MSHIDHPHSSRRSGKGLAIGITVGVFAFIGVIWAFMSLHNINQYEVGVLVDNGEVTEQLNPGWNFVPGVRQQVETVVTAPTDGEVTGLSIATSDNFGMNETTVSFTRVIPPEVARELIATTPFYEQTIATVVSQVAKNVLGNYELIEVPENRGEIEAKMLTAANAQLSELLPIDNPLQNVVLSTYQWEESARTFLAEVRAQMEEIRKAEIQAEKDKIARLERIAEAKTAAKEARIESERADADTKSAALAQAEADETAHNERMRQQRAENEAELAHLNALNEARIAHLRAVSETVGTDGAIAMERWEKWNGQLPMLGAGQLEMKREIGTFE